MALAQTPSNLLEIAYEIEGPRKGRPVLLLHVWPDSAQAWSLFMPRLNAAGYQNGRTLSSRRCADTFSPAWNAARLAGRGASSSS